MQLSLLVVDVDADGAEQHQALDHLLVVDATPPERASTMVFLSMVPFLYAVRVLTGADY
jgi:hypothetical protein